MKSISRNIWAVFVGLAVSGGGFLLLLVMIDPYFHGRGNDWEFLRNFLIVPMAFFAGSIVTGLWLPPYKGESKRSLSRVVWVTPGFYVFLFYFILMLIKTATAQGAPAGDEPDFFSLFPALISAFISSLVGVKTGEALGARFLRRREDVGLESRYALDADNLREIGRAVSLYCSDHGGELPNSLGALLDDDYIKDASRFLSPGSTTDVPSSGAEVDSGSCDYLYLVSSTTDRQTGTHQPLAVTEQGILRDGFVNVLFADGRVKGYFSLPTAIAQALSEIRVAGSVSKIL